MLKFVTTDAATFGHKRKQTQHACEHCRRKKKRCNHDEPSHVADHPSTASNNNSLPSISSPQNDHQIQLIDNLQSRLESEHAKGAINSLSTFENPTPQANDEETPLRTPQSLTTASLAPNGDDTEYNSGYHEVSHEKGNLGSRFIGDLNPEGVFLAATSPETSRNTSSTDSIGVWLAERLSKRAVQLDPKVPQQQSRASLFYGSPRLIQSVLVPILQQECAAVLPPPGDVDALCLSYFRNIHPVFPVIDENEFQSLPLADPARILLQQGIFLVASMNFSMEEHLRLADGEHRLSYGEFGTRILAAMRMSVEIGLVTDKIVLIPALALMSFFVEGPEGRELSTHHCGKAVQYVHSLGLHLQGHHHDQVSEYAVTLFCCIWALDRLNAAFHGRPVLMHQRDLGRNLEDCVDQQQPSFRLFLRVIMLLDKVIDIYRPMLDPDEAEWKGDFPLFEDLLVRCASSQVPTSLLDHGNFSADDEYQATIEILYHAVAILSYRSRSSERTSRSSASFIRQRFSAGRVTSIVRDEFSDQLVLFPFVPYAVSLSLSIAYHDMRHNKVPMYRARAQVDLKTNCRLLESLGKIFWSASVMADMGKLTLRELDKVYFSVTDAQQRSNQNGIHNPTTNETNANYSNLQSLGATQEGAPQAQESEPNLVDGNSEIPAQSQQDLNNLFSFNETPGLDIFEMFDPNFDLDGIDACLEGNLDLSFLINMP